MGWDKEELAHHGLGFDLQVTVSGCQRSRLALKYRLGKKTKKNNLHFCQLHQHIQRVCLSPHASSQRNAIFLSFLCLSTSPTLWFHFCHSLSAFVDSRLLLPSWLPSRARLVQRNSRIWVSKHACGVIITCNVSARHSRKHEMHFFSFSFLGKMSQDFTLMMILTEPGVSAHLMASRWEQSDSNRGTQRGKSSDRSYTTQIRHD